MALTSDEALQRIDSKLDQILRIAALRMIEGLKQGPAIQLLATAGFDRRLIAELLKTTPNTVSVTLSKAKPAKKPTENDVNDT